MNTNRTRRHPIASRAVLGVLAAVGLAACGDSDDPDAAEPTSSPAGIDAEGVVVTINTFAFEPDPLVVEAGTTITFANEDAIDHTVTAGTREAPEQDRFDGRLPEQGSTFELTLDEPGTYDYFCEIHPGPGMTGAITVE